MLQVRVIDLPTYCQHAVCRASRQPTSAPGRDRGDLSMFLVMVRLATELLLHACKQHNP